MTDPLIAAALEAGGHLGDDAAYIVVHEWLSEWRADRNELAETLVSDDPALD